MFGVMYTSKTTAWNLALQQEQQIERAFLALFQESRFTHCINIIVERVILIKNNRSMWNVCHTFKATVKVRTEIYAQQEKYKHMFTKWRQYVDHRRVQEPRSWNKELQFIPWNWHPAIDVCTNNLSLSHNQKDVYAFMCMLHWKKCKLQVAFLINP